MFGYLSVQLTRQRHWALTCVREADPSSVGLVVKGNLGYFVFGGVGFERPKRSFAARKTRSRMLSRAAHQGWVNPLKVRLMPSEVQPYAGSPLRIHIFSNARNDKTQLKAGFVEIVGGVDGTRTRDPRRDRPVF